MSSTEELQQPNLYVVFPGMVPQLDQIESAVEGHFNVVLVDKIEVLAKYRQEAGVVILGCQEPGKMAHFLGMIRTFAPYLSSLSVINTEQLGELSLDTMRQTDLLMMPLKPEVTLAALYRAHELSQMKHLVDHTAQLDDVTALYNQQYFIKRLGEELSLGRRHQAPVACIIVDMAFYRVYMDSYGYSFVADVLKRVAEVVQDGIRKEDLVARLGDSEIGILLPRSSEQGAMVLAQRLVDKLMQLEFQMGGQTEKLELSAGVAAFPFTDPNDTDPNSLIRYTRHALHQGKLSEEPDCKVVAFSSLRPVV